MRDHFDKEITEGVDQLKVSKGRESDWVHISINHSAGHEMGNLTLRSEQAVRDLYYLLGQLLDQPNRS